MGGKRSVITTQDAHASTNLAKTDPAIAIIDANVRPAIEAALMVAALAVLVDIALSWTPAPVTQWRDSIEAVIPGPFRAALVKNLLLAFGLPIALFITLTSLAVPTLSNVANPSVMLLHRQYNVGPWFSVGGSAFPPPARWRLIRRYALRTNVFYLALLSSLCLSLTLAGLLTAQRLGLTAITPPIVLFIGWLVLCVLLLLLRFVYWILLLRQPAELVGHLTRLALNVFAYVGAAPRLRARVGGELPSAEYVYEEQLEIAKIVALLEEIGLRGLAERQPATVREAIGALRAIARLSREQRPALARTAWHELKPERAAGTDEGATARVSVEWLERLVVDAIAAVLLAAIASNARAIGVEAASALLGIATSAVVPEPTPADRSMLEAVFGHYENAFDSAVRNRDSTIRSITIEQLRALAQTIMMVKARDDSPEPSVRGVLRNRLPTTASTLMRACVVMDDQDALGEVIEFVAGLVFRENLAVIRDRRVEDNTYGGSETPEENAAGLTQIIALEVTFDAAADALALGRTAQLRELVNAAALRLGAQGRGVTEAIQHAFQRATDTGFRASYTTRNHVGTVILLAKDCAGSTWSGAAAIACTAIRTDGGAELARMLKEARGALSR